VTGSPEVVVRYWAAARAAAAVAEERYDAPADLGALLDAVRARHGAGSRLAEVLARCSYLVDEVSPGRRAPADVPLHAGAVVDVLPPFAGGSGARAEDGGGTADGGGWLAPA
jgi:molybdopterin converting factor small subunit